MRSHPSDVGSLTEAAYRRLRAEIVLCRLKPGERIRIADLCGLLDTNLSAVREALSRLLADGLVVSEPQKGFRIAPISVSDLHDLAFVRAEVELLCLRRSMADGGIEWESALVAAFHRLSRTSERVEGPPDGLSSDYLKAAEAFFEAMMAACDNLWLLRIRRQTYMQYERYRCLTVLESIGRRDLQDEFRGLLDAVLARNIELAELRLRTMITPAQTFIDSLSRSVEITPVEPCAEERHMPRGTA